MSDSSPLFIVSCARSGSTLLRLMLDAHPAIWSPPELHLLTLGQRLLWTHGVLGDHGEPPEGFWDQVAVQVRADIDRILAPHLAASGKRRWCEKSVTAVNHLDVLKGVFGDAHVVLLYRHISDMVDSGLRATEDRPDGYDFEPYFAAWPHSRLEALAHYWQEKTAAMLALEHSAQRCHRLRYEDLVKHPQQSLNGVAAFLGEAAPADWAEQVYRLPHQRGPGDTRAYSAGAISEKSVGNGRQRPWHSLPRRLVRQLDETLEMIDYQRLTP